MTDDSRSLTTDQHTIGPWIAEVSDILGIIVYAEKCHSMIAPCNTLGSEGAAFVDSVEQQAANARLIAAAPDLLTLAHQYAAECAQCAGSGKVEMLSASGHPAGKIDCKDCADIRAVIAKAEGRRVSEQTRPLSEEKRCPLIGTVIFCQCGNPSSHYGTMGVHGAREVREEAPPRKAYSDPKGGPEYDAP